MKRNNAKRVLALVLASVMLMQQSWVGTLAAETETVTEAQTEKLTEAPATEAPAPETKAEETQAPATKAEETQTPATEAPAEGEETGETQTPATEAPGETATEAPTEAPTEAVTEAVTEASTEAITEKESETEEEVVLDTAIKQEVFQKTVEDDVQPMIKYTVKVTNKAKTAVAEGVSVKVILADALSYAEEEGETAELGVYGKFDDAVNADVFKDIELSENVMDVYAEGSVALWQNQKIAAGEKKEFVFFAAVEDGVTDTEALRNLWFVNDEAVANDKLQWQNAELLKVEEELPTEFTCEYGNMVVTATLSDGAILPEGAQFVVTEKTLSEEEVALVEDAMGEDSADAPEEKQGEDGQTEETVADYVAYDMHFEVNGAEVEPQGGTVSVVISYNDALVMTPADEKADDMEIVEGSAEYQVLHLADDSTVEDVTDSVSATDDGKVSEVGFTTDSFSTFVIRGGWMTIAGSIEIFIDKIRLGTHEYTNINIDDASGIYTGFFDGNHDYRRYVVYVGETMQLSAAVPSSGAWKFEGGSDGIGSVNGTSNAVSSGKLTASFTGERVGDCSILLKNGDNTEKTFYITVKEPIYVKTKIDNIRHKDTINENLPGITTGYGEENYIWNPIASEDGSHERLYIKNFGMIKDGDANGGKYVAYPGDTISLTGVSNGGSEFSIDSSYGGIQEVTHSKDGNRATITCKVKEDAETGKQTYIQFGNEKFYIYVKPSENDANHFDIEIKDGGTYTITETQIDATGKETKIETVYNVFVCGVNYCNVYNADGKIITDSEGNLVGHLTAGEYWESDLGPDSTQYELSSAYQTDGKGHLRDGVNKVPETRAIKRTDVDKVVFNLELLLKPISRKVDGTDASVAGIDDFEVTGFNATMDKQDIMDASNKCPTNTGLDFTLDIHSRAILIQPKVQKILKDDTLQNGQFWFDLYSEDPSGENVEPIGTVSNTNTGEVLFKQILLSDDEIGTGTEKIYYIKERIPENKEKDSHIIYDTRIIKMVVKINAGDSLSADISYYYLDEKDAETLIKETPQFVNYKTTPEKTETTPGEGKMVEIGQEITYEITWENYRDEAAEVFVTDVLDPGVDFVSADPEETSYENHTVKWDLGEKKAGDSGKVTLTVKVNKDAFKNYQYDEDSDIPTDKGGKDHQVVNRAGVQVGNDSKVLTKIIPNPVPEKEETDPGKDELVGIGQEITYKIHWKNGHEESADVTITDKLDPGVDFESADHEGNHDEATHTVTWVLKAQPGGAEGDVELKVRVNKDAKLTWDYTEGAGADEDGKILNQAGVKIGNDDEVKTEIIPNPVDEGPEKTELEPGDRKMVGIGDEIVYKITWKNYQDAEADVVITDKLDPGVEFVKASDSGTPSGDVVTWNLGKKAAKSEGFVTLTVKVTEKAFEGWEYVDETRLEDDNDKFEAVDGKDYEVWNRAAVKVGNDPKVYTNIVENPVPEKTEPTPGDRLMVNVGDPITYEIGWKNGYKKEAEVIVTDPLEPGVSYVSSEPTGTYDEKTHTVTWEFKAKSEEKGTIKLNVTVNENAFKDWKYGEADAPVVNADEKVKDYEVWNRAKVQIDDDSQYTAIVENPVPEKTEQTPGDRVMVNVGDPITYEIGWKNGHKEAAKVTVTDPLDPGVTYESSKPEGKYDEKTHTVTWEFEAKGEEKGTIELNVTVNENVFKDWKYGEADAPVVNADEKAKDYEVWNRAKVQVGNDSAYTDIVENSVPEKTEVTPGKGIMTEVGKDITYEIHWKNGHKEPATVTVTDKLDPGVTFKSADNGGTCKDGVVTWTLNAAAGEEGSVKLIVTVNENAYDTWQYGGGDKPVAGEGKDYEVLNRASVKVGHDPAVMTDIIPNPVPEKTEVTPGKGIMTEVGKDIMYEIHWKNGHDEPATVTVTDKLDPGVTFKSADNGGTCTDGVVTWMLNAAAGEEGSVKLTVTVNENAYKTYTYGDGDTPTAGEGKDYEVLNRAGVQVGNDAKVLTNIIPNPVPEKEEIDPGANETVYVGDQITYEIYWKNGHDTAADVTVTDPLDEGLDFVSADQGGTYDSATRTVTWVIRNVAAGQSGKVTLTTKVNLDARKDDHIVENQAGVQVGHDPKVLTQIIPNPTPEEPRNGKISVTKELTVLGEKVFAVDETFYVALFSDEACKKRVTEIKALEFKRASSATVTFENIDIGRIYYVGEVNSDGEVILNGKVKDGTLFTANFNKGKSIVVENSDGSGTIVFENTFREIPPGFYREGVLNITKKLLGVDGEALESDETFYAGIFADEAHTTLSDKVTRNVVALELNGSSSASESVSVVCEPGKKTTLYVTEVTSDGTPVGKSFGYTVTVDNGEVTLDESNMSANVTITNQEQEETESEFESESESEAVKSTARSVKTGDNTPIARYVLLMLAAAVLATMVAVLRRRRRIEK